MTEKEVKRIAGEAAKCAVKEIFISLGVDTSNPIRTQQDMASVRQLAKIIHDPKYQADQVHLRKWRTAMESASRTSFRVTVATITTGVLGFIIYAVGEAFGR